MKSDIYIQYNDNHNNKLKIRKISHETTLTDLRSNKIGDKIKFYYEFIDKENDAIDIEEEKEIKVSEIIEGNVIKIQPYIQVFDEDDKLILKSTDEKENLSSLRSEIKRDKKEDKLEEFVFLDNDMKTKIEETNEETKKCEDIMGKNDKKIFIYKKYKFFIKLGDNSISSIICEKNLKLSQLREQYKNENREDLDNYIFLNKDKKEILISSERVVSIQDIYDEDYYINTKKNNKLINKAKEEEERKIKKKKKKN